MRKMKRGAALLMAAATLASLPAIPFAVPMIPAAAASSVQTIQTRVFRYDFGSFCALYDTRGGKWYDESGNLLKSATEPVQVWERGNLTVDFEKSEAYILKSEGTKQMNSVITEFLQNTLKAFVPDYATEYYDKAQQKSVSVPKPASFPLTFRILQDTDVFTVEVLIGENSLGQFTGSRDMMYQGDGTVGYCRPDAYTDAGDLTVDGQISIADAIYSTRVAAEDTGLRISALGLELADEDGDGMVGIGDVRALLDELVKPLQQNRAYMKQVSEIYAHETLRDLVLEEEVNVVPVEGDDFFTTVYRCQNGSADLMAQAHGFDDAGQMFRSFEDNGGLYHFLASCEEGEEYDRWYLSVFTGSDTYKYAELQEIKLTDAGLLSVNWEGLENRSDPTQDYNAFTHILTVKHGVWSEVKNSSPSMGMYSEISEERFAADVGGLLKITRTKSTPQEPLGKNTIPVLYQQTETVQWWRGDDNPGSEYKNWSGKADFELAMKTLCKDHGDELLAVLPKGDELKVYTVYYGLPREHRLGWLNLLEDGNLIVGDIADMRQKYSYQPICTAHLMTIFADTLTLPEGALPADAIKSVQWDNLCRWQEDADRSLAEMNGIPWDESNGLFPFRVGIGYKGCDYTGLNQDQTIVLNELMRDTYDFCAAEPDESGEGDGTGGWISLNGMTDRIAKQHGYADAAAMLTERKTTDSEPVFLYDIVKGEEFDELRLTDIDNRSYYDCRVTGLHLDKDGKMQVTWSAVKKSTSGQASNIFSNVMLVRHGILDQVKEWSFERVQYEAANASDYDALTEKPLTISRENISSQKTKSVPVLTHEHEKLDWNLVFAGEREWDGWADYKQALNTLADKRKDTSLAVLPKPDALNIYFTDYAWTKEYSIESLKLDEDGELTVTVGLYPYSDEMYETIFADYLTLPAGTLTADSVKSVKLVIHDYLDEYDEYVVIRGEQWEAFQAAVPETLTLEIPDDGTAELERKDQVYQAADHQVLCDQYHVNRTSSTTQNENGETEVQTAMSYATLNGNLEQIAKLHKFENGAELINALDEKKAENGIKFLASCEEGEEYDKWYLSFFFDQLFNRCELSKLNFTAVDTGCLNMSLSLLYDTDTNGMFYNAFTHILTLPHGLWEKVNAYQIVPKIYKTTPSDHSASEAFAESYTEPLTLTIPGNRMGTGIYTMNGLEHEQEKLMYFDLPENWDGREDFETAKQTLSSKTEWKVGDIVVGSAELSVLQKEDALKLYITSDSEEISWSTEFGIESMYLDPDGKLTVTAGFYPYSDELYPVLFAETVKTGDDLNGREIRSVELIPHFYRDPWGDFSAIRGEQWEAFQAAAKKMSFTVEGVGIPIARAYR